MESEGHAARIRRLEAEAKGLAAEHINEYVSLIIRLQAMSAEIAAGGQAYPDGVREIARPMAEDLDSKAQMVEAVLARAPR